MIITIEIPGAPTGKGRARSTSNGHHYTPAKTRAAEGYIQHLAAIAMQGLPRFEEPVSMSIDIAIAPVKSMPKRQRDEALCGRIRPAKKPDCDNIVKLISDALNTIVWRDDAQVVDLVVRKRYDLNERTTVIVSLAGAS
jgi:Holliday junction resolvase RusA-like endonuclease